MVRAEGARAAIRSWSHAQSYQGLSPAALVHRARLRQVCALVRELSLPAQGLLVDLGCSDGFVATHLREAGTLPDGWQVHGYDRNRRLIRVATARGLAGARFAEIDLNDGSTRIDRPGDLVVCLETLEHVGSYRAALEVVHHALAPGGVLLLSMPNEVGVVGLGKLVGRPVLRRHPYQGFFPDRRAVYRYALDVTLHKEIEHHRQPARAGWAPHLGFDHRAVLRHIERTYLETGLWVLERVHRSALGANHFLVVRRTGEA